MSVNRTSQPANNGIQPSVPTGIIATAVAGNQATIAFTLSINPGKGAGNYVATSSPGGFTGSSSSSPITITGLSAGTDYTFTVIKQSSTGISSVSSAASGSIRAFTTPAAPVISFTNTKTSVDWSWSSGGNNGSDITHWEYTVMTNGVWGSPVEVVATTTGYPSNIANEYNTNTYKISVRARNAAGYGPAAESATSSNWTRTATGSNYSADEQQNTTADSCPSTCCTSCGTQARVKYKLRYRTYRNDTWRWNGDNSTQTKVELVADYPDWSTVTVFTPCSDSGACSAGTLTAYSGSDGEKVFVGGEVGRDYRVWSSLYNGWYVANSSGAASWISGPCGGTCSSQNCIVLSTGMSKCNATVCTEFVPSGIAIRGLCGNFGFGCTGVVDC